MEIPPVLEDIESDPRLAGIKLIAEAWDAAGLYQVGTFVGDSWKEWNGKFRDDIRSFLRTDNGTVQRVAARLLASPDIYGHEEREPEQSINFVTCHDGFTLNDLLSYDHKHNEANGEENRDGSNNNLSWNCGVEGPTDDPEIERLRNRQAKNFIAMTLLSLGAPMLLMGDEVRRTQRGNNNVYCQNNEISWFDWTLLEKHGELHRFAKYLYFQSLTPGNFGRGRGHKSQRSYTQSPNSMAWRKIEPARLEPRFPLLSNQCPQSDHRHHISPDAERLLGRSGIRTPIHRLGREGPLASLD